MNEFYMEQLVPRKTATKQNTITKIICLVLTMVFIALSFIIGLSLIPAIILIIVDIILMKNSNIEYEYLYLNGDLDIDKVIAKQRRKHAISVSMENVEIIAPKNSGEVRTYQKVKTLDFSSGIDSPAVYKMVLTKNNDKMAILFEPNKALLDGMRMIAPRKVIL